MPTISCFKIMQIRSGDIHRLKTCSWNGNTFSCVLNFFTGCIMLRPFNISLLCLAFFRHLKAKALRSDKNALGDWVWLKNRLFSKTVKNSKKAKHSFVHASITHCPKPVRFNNSQQKVLPLFSDRVESRDNICIIEKHQNRKHTCMYLAKSHLSRA